MVLKYMNGDIVQFKYGFKSTEIKASIKYGKYLQSKCDEYECEHYGFYIAYEHQNYCKNTGLDLFENNKVCEVIGNVWDNKNLLEE